MPKITQRPSLPAFTYLALSLWASCAASLWYLRTISNIPFVPIVLISCACIVILATLMWKLARVEALILVLLGASLGVLMGTYTSYAYLGAQASSEGVWGTFIVEACSDSSQGAYGASCKVKATYPDGQKHYLLMKLPEDVDELRYGTIANVKGYLAAPSDVARDYYWREGLVAQLKASSVEVTPNASVFSFVVTCRNKAIDTLLNSGVDDGGLAAALLCGWRGSLDDDLYQAFQTTGLAHVVAVSGAHLAIVSSFVRLLLQQLKVRRSLISLIQFIFILSYLVFTGMPISAIRSAVMVICGLSAWTAKRRPSHLSALSICVLVFICLDSHCALSLSFALSALSTLGIILFGRLFSSCMFELSFMPRFAADALALTFSSSLMTIPLSAAVFSKLPLISPLANVVIAPLFAPVCTLGLLALTASSIFSFVPCAALASWLAKLFGWLIKCMGEIPYASVPASIDVIAALIVSFALVVALWAVWPNPKAVLYSCIGFVSCALSLFLISGLSSAQSTSITMLDVGQGDAFLLQSNGYRMLIDTGNQDTLLLQALARSGVTHLDAVLISHSDDDHMGSLKTLKGVVEVDRVLVASDAKTCGCDNCRNLISAAEHVCGSDYVEALDFESEVSFGAINLKVIWPHEYADDGGNADSLCLFMSADINQDSQVDWTALFVGDVEYEQLWEIQSETGINNLDIYKVGHHGSKNALTEDLALQLSPKLSLISVGENNRYGHPNSQILEWLNEAGSEIARSDVQGDVCCVLGLESIKISTLR